MPEQLSPANFLQMRHSGVVIDVRTPAEFAQGHIPGAINLPLFSNEERAVVGTLYKQHSKEKAVEKGLELVGPKLAGFVKEAKLQAQTRPLFIHCWRGGMRSSSMAWLMETAGMKTYLLEGGYKAYRSSFDTLLAAHPWRILVLNGSTGCGKTEILKSLAQQGEQVLDLEGLAHHKGSVFGALGQSVQPTNEQFQNEIHEQMIAFNPAQPLWVEGESRTIGHNFIPNRLFALMEAAHATIEIEMPLPLRLDRLVREYASYEPIRLIEGFIKIQKRLGGLRTQQAIAHLLENQYREAAAIALHYYDKGYANALAKQKGSHTLMVVEKDDPVETARKLKSLRVEELKS